MIALLVAMNVMAIGLSVALPAWRTFVQREKEAELVFRGEQYARAITLFQRKYGNAAPPNLDVLVEERFLRKKYKDPITGEDFLPIMAGQALPGDLQPQTPGARGAGSQGRGGSQAPQFQQTVQQTQQALRQLAQQTGGIQAGGNTGIIAVTSKSEAKSFRLYKGRDTYNAWVFMGIQQSARIGGPGGRAGQTGVDGRGGRGAVPQPPGRGAVPPPARGTPPPVTPGRGFGGRNFPD